MGLDDYVNGEGVEDEGRVYRITPKGIIAVYLSETFGIDLGELDRLTALAQKLEDMLFKAGYLIYHEDQIEFIDGSSDD